MSQSLPSRCVTGATHLHLDPLGGIAGDMFIAAVPSAFPDLQSGMVEAIREEHAHRAFSDMRSMLLAAPLEEPVLAQPGQLALVCDACFEQTTTLGLRYQLLSRATLARSFALNFVPYRNGSAFLHTPEHGGALP